MRILLLSSEIIYLCSQLGGEKFSLYSVCLEKILRIFFFKSLIFMRDFSKENIFFICFLTIIIITILLVYLKYPINKNFFFLFFGNFNVSVKVLKITFFSLLSFKDRIISQINKCFHKIQILLCSCLCLY